MANHRGWNRNYSDGEFIWRGGPRELLAERRDKRRWTAQQLAQRVEEKTEVLITAHEITMFENGQRSPSVEQMRAISIALGLSEDWFEGSDVPDEQPTAAV